MADALFKITRPFERQGSPKAVAFYERLNETRRSQDDDERIVLLRGDYAYASRRPAEDTDRRGSAPRRYDDVAINIEAIMRHAECHHAAEPPVAIDYRQRRALRCQRHAGRQHQEKRRALPRPYHAVGFSADRAAEAGKLMIPQTPPKRRRDEFIWAELPPASPSVQNCI